MAQKSQKRLNWYIGLPKGQYSSLADHHAFNVENQFNRSNYIEKMLSQKMTKIKLNSMSVGDLNQKLYTTA